MSPHNKPTTIMIALSIITIFIILTIIGSLNKKFRHVFIVWENQTAMHFIHGRLVKTLNPGRHVIWGLGHSIKTLDNRLQHIVLQNQEIPASDGITVKTSVVGLYKIDDAIKAFQTSSDSTAALHTLIQLALRDEVCSMDTEELLKLRSQLGPRLIDKINTGANNLGITVTELAVRDIILPGEVKRALTSIMQAKHEAKAELEVARGRAAAMRTLANSAKQFEAHPSLLKLRYIEALEKAAETHGNTFIIGQHELPHNI